MKGINELENVLLDQIEKLNDDSLFEDKEKADVIIQKSNSVANLARNYMEVQRFKLDVVKEMNLNGDMYGGLLGIESK